ncbi:hypothetical protein DM39_2241 [Burkholderia cenocepacia]|uniref:Uncharacterized protein n=1 Tax=Burkholderia cenocepacia TaxID=95486 RepID=A0AAN0VNP8_9BURK|nr:hypothetical protein DM39_2241 [Burkholderia cenocepacia]
MAGIWKRGKYWRVEIRRIGYPKIAVQPILCFALESEKSPPTSS